MGAETRSQLTDPICFCPSKLDIQQRALENFARIAQKHGKHMDCEAFALQYLGQSLMLLLFHQYFIMVTGCCTVSHLHNPELFFQQRCTQVLTRACVCFDVRVRGVEQ